MVYITTFLGVSTTLFLIGILGIVLNRKNILIILMSVELML
jgi:NADH-quinone oxidoreductase subunit K